MGRLITFVFLAALLATPAFAQVYLIPFVPPAGGGTDLTAKSSCLGAWLDDEASGTAIEDECDAGGATTFTHLATTPDYKTVGGFNYVLVDGNGDWMEMSDATSADIDTFTTAVTVGGIVELTATDFSSIVAVFYPTSEMDFEFRGSDTPQDMRWTSNVNATSLDGPDQDAGDFVFFAITHDGATDTAELFIDGTSDETASFQSTDYSADSAEACVGAELVSDACSATFAETGYVSSLAVFDEVLSDCEICDWCRFGLSGDKTDRGDTACNSCTPC